MVNVHYKMHRRPRRLLILALLALAAAGLAASSTQAQATALTVEEVRALALSHNRLYLSALDEVKKAGAEIVRARSGALPTLSANAAYNRNFMIPSTYVTIGDQTEQFKFGFKNNFSAGLSLRQSIYQGGKVFTALAIAKLYRKFATAGLDSARAAVIYNAEILFYQTILQRSRLDVLRKALEADSLNLENVEKMYSQGTVSEFEVLRARVEKNNLLPQILQAESDAKLAEKRLKSFVGIDLEHEITTVDDATDTTLGDLSTLSYYVDTALAARPEMQQATYLSEISKRAVKVAKAEFWPSLEAVGSYGWQAQSDDFTLSQNTTNSLTAGFQVSIPIFSGGSRFGDVAQRKAEYNQTKLLLSQQRDNVRLEVEAAYDQLIQAKKALDIQGVNIAEAQEGLKIANVRYESGVGTLLEVLSAQVALTSARNAMAMALYSFRSARAQLKQASTIEVGME